MIAGGTGGATEAQDFWVFKTDARGRLVWNKTFDHLENVGSMEQARCVIRAHDSGYVIAGFNYEFTSYWNMEPWLVKVHEDGELAWPIRVFGVTSRDDAAYSVIATSDGGYLLTGSRKFGIGTSDNLWLLKTDGTGNEVWNRTLTNDVCNLGSCVSQTADGGYLVGGWTHLATFKTDANGLLLETKVQARGGTLDRGCSWIAGTPDGGTALVGSVGQLRLALERLHWRDRQ